MPRHSSFSVRQPVLIISLCLFLIGLPAVPKHLINLILPVARAATTFTVSSTGDGADSNLADGVCNDGTGACTLRAAIQETNVDTIDKEITFAPGLIGTITLNTALPNINCNLTILGPGAPTLTVQRNTAGGTPNFRIFTINSGKAVALSGLTLANGNAAGGSFPDDSGGGILNQGTLVVNLSVISGNHATFGAGISSSGSMTLRASTVANNTAVTNGGGVSNVGGGTSTISGSTISANNCGSQGGGIYNSGNTLVFNSTISTNTAVNGGGFANVGPATLTNSTIVANTGSGAGGGVYNPGIGILTLKNMLIAGNTSPAGPDCFGANFVSQDYNLIGNTSGAQIVGTTTHNITNVNALLGPLAANGGPTLTHAILPGSPAIDAGSNANLPSDTFDLDGDGNTSEPIPFDQRGTGFNRTADGNGDGTSTVDIGAYEVQSILVTNTDDSGPGSLRQTIIDANATAVADAINFQAGLTGTITLSSALPDLSTSIAINGPGASLLTIQRSPVIGTPTFRIFTVNNGVTTIITNLTISNGNLTGSGNNGGGLLNNGTLILTSCNIYGNSTTSIGGGIFNDGPSLTLNNCNIGGTGTGQSNIGGGIVHNGGSGIRPNEGTLLMTGGSIAGNTGNGISIFARATLKGVAITDNGVGGGVFVASNSTTSIMNCLVANNTNASTGGFGGGGIVNRLSIINVFNSTISGNMTSGSGGGIWNFNGSITLTNVTITNNRAGQGGGIDAGGSVLLNNSIVAGNLATLRTTDDIMFPVSPASAFNLIGIGGDLTNGVNNNQVGVVNPGLHVLANNGGSTPTHALLPGSLAFDAASNNLATDAGLATDQRGVGFSRIVDGPDVDTTATVDIGAFEALVSVENITDKILNEDTQIQFSFNVGGSGSITSVTATSSNATVVPPNTANIAVTGSGSTRTLTINPAADQFGTTTITVTVNGNNSQSMTDTFLLTVNPVNDAPRFTRGPNQTVNNNAGLQTVANWATSILAGPANESGQTLSFLVVGNNNPGLFAVAPAISSTGVLTYAPATNAGGTAIITVVLQDNGGTSSGGQDTSPAQSFSITVIPVGGFLKFESSDFSTTESSGFTTITVIRAGDLTREVTVNYATSADIGMSCSTATGVASSKCDFNSALGTLSFTPGESSRTFTVLISQDSYVEGTETLTLSLSNPAGGSALDAPSTATLTITDDATEPATNPNDIADIFVRQHYHDFLNREPDAAGLAFWSDQITSCGTDTACVELRRINVSAAFFLSIEFQQTGYLVYRMYKAAYDDLPNAPVPVVLNEFHPDTQEIGRGVVVGQIGWEEALENNKQAFAAGFVARSRFTTVYPTTHTPAEFVDALFTNAGVTPSASDRQAAIDEFGAGASNTADIVARARALRRVAENSTLTQQEFNKAFVLMQYVGYLRRNPNDAPEPGLNFDGYNFWLNKLNQFGGNFVNAEMVKAFIVSVEYRQRFGP